MNTNIGFDEGFPASHNIHHETDKVILMTLPCMRACYRFGRRFELGFEYGCRTNVPLHSEASSDESVGRSSQTICGHGKHKEGGGKQHLRLHRQGGKSET